MFNLQWPFVAHSFAAKIALVSGRHECGVETLCNNYVDLHAITGIGVYLSLNVFQRAIVIYKHSNTCGHVDRYIYNMFM